MKIKNLDVFDKHYDLFIGGEWTPGHGQETIVATNPADGTVLSTFVDATDGSAVEDS